MKQDFGTTASSLLSDQTTGDPGSVRVAKHTPGPWIYDPAKVELWAPEITALGYKVGASIAHFRSGPSPADGVLISAAPDLFVVANHPILEWLCGEGLDSIPEPQRTGVKLFLAPLRQAAILKATISVSGSPVVNAPSNEEVVVP